MANTIRAMGAIQKDAPPNKITESSENQCLPTAEYNYSGSETPGQVLDLAKGATSETNKRFAVLVAESNG